MATTEETTLPPQEIQEEQLPQESNYNNNNKATKLSHENNWTSKEADEADSDSSVHTLHGLRYLYNGYRFLGVYFPKTKKPLYLIWSIFIHIYVTIGLPTGFIMGIIADVTDENVEIGNLLTSVQVAINVLGCSTKIILMSILFPKLRKCETIFEQLDKRCISREEKQLVRRFMHDGNRLVLLFTIAYWSYSSSTMISTVIFGRLPYNIYNPFIDAEASRGNFILAVIMEMIPVDIACFMQVVDDSYAVIYVQILRTHVQALIVRLENLNQNQGEEKEDADAQQERNVEKLRLCIIDHQNIIELYNRVSPVISITIFVQFTITASLLGSTLINILIFATNTASMVASCFYVLAVVVEVFPLCYYAQCLMDENIQLTDAIFHSNWVYQNERYRKMLIFFMQRSQKVIEFTAGKLFPITLSSFLSIAKFSFSLYTLIKEMDLKERYGLN
ncbi:odorant receptor 7a-like [Musca vetustissima]|uniref:odorant receptor 7a-like n=1 Tax=Musca vetustissima TaxID=27455 RepID=UPI002AB5F114|nr:odorant receptor 7a-like [Musca vetustissima]